MATTCPVCLEAIESELDRSMTKCGHLFHSSCLCHSCVRDKRCPLCREALYESHVIEDTALHMTLLTRALIRRARASETAHREAIDEAVV